MDKGFPIFSCLKITCFHINTLICLCRAELLKEELTHLIGTIGLKGNFLDKVRT